MDDAGKTGAVEGFKVGESQEAIGREFFFLRLIDKHRGIPLGDQP